MHDDLDEVGGTLDFQLSSTSSFIGIFTHFGCYNCYHQCITPNFTNEKTRPKIKLHKVLPCPQYFLLHCWQALSRQTSQPQYGFRGRQMQIKHSLDRLYNKMAKILSCHWHSRAHLALQTSIRVHQNASLLQVPPALRTRSPPVIQQPVTLRHQSLLHWNVVDQMKESAQCQPVLYLR